MGRARKTAWRIPAWRLATACALAALLAFLLGRPGETQPAEVDVNLVLAVDASGSVSEERFELQKQGYVAALRHPQVLRAIRSGRTQAIAVTMTQWTGPTLQVVVVPWTLVRDEGSAAALADRIAAAPRQLFAGGTSISGAIDFGVALLEKAPYRSFKRIIDVSGDGSNNRGRPVTLARDEAVRAGITINGLPILALEPNLDRYYFDNVIGGPGAIMVPAVDYGSFAQAILKKLVLEIATLGR